MKSTLQLVNEIKLDGSDYEFYPSTDAIVNCVKERLKGNETVLDVGAGSGTVLTRLGTSGQWFAIEKSKPLITAMSKDILIVGTNLYEQSLIDISVNVIFCNPPYSQFIDFSRKIIMEANASKVYLVIPTRWVNSVEIADALKERKAVAKTLLTTDFLSADRKARAVVDVLEIDLTDKKLRGYGCQDQLSVDPFELWFKQHFPLNKSVEDEKSQMFSTASIKNQLVAGSDIIQTLEQLYNREFDNLLTAYKSLCNIDSALLKELNVDRGVLTGGLKQKIQSLKDKFWKILFDNISSINTRLTTASRNELHRTLTKQSHIDFTRLNCYAILEWVIKSANLYFDDQLLDVFDKMIEKANVVNYKSNAKVFDNEDWRYRSRPNRLSHFSLEYRVVLERIGGIDTSWSYRENKITERASNFLNDLCTVGYNLGFDTTDTPCATSFHWTSGKKVDFIYFDHKSNSTKVLFTAKAYKNGNLHIYFNSLFMCKLNVENGRLRGWIKSKEEAAVELDLDINNIDVYFNSNLQIESGTCLLKLENQTQKAA